MHFVTSRVLCLFALSANGRTGRVIAFTNEYPLSDKRLFLLKITQPRYQSLLLLTMKKLFLRTVLSLLIFLYCLLVCAAPLPLPSAQFPVPSNPPFQSAALLSPCPAAVTAAQFLPTATATDAPKAGTYACVLSDDAYFYLSAGGKDGAFLLPRTYYVRLLSFGATYSKVEYMETDTLTRKLTGYVRTEHLAFVDYVPARPYLTYVFDLTYRLEDTTPGNGDSFTELTFTCAYYGDYPIGDSLWCYVLREGEFGYVPKPDHLAFEENTEYADYLASRQPPDDEQTERQKSASSPAQIAILITLCLLVPLLAALILKPPRKPPYETDD